MKTRQAILLLSRVRVVFAYALALLCAPVSGFAAIDLPAVRCVSNYLVATDDEYDVLAWKHDLERMKHAGFNTVWIVNIWKGYQPKVNPPTWREDRLTALREICAAAKERDMNVLLVPAYIGEGWGPEGVDAAVWPLVEKQRQQHLAYLRRVARETRDFPNVFYLLCSELILPATVIIKPNTREESVTSFRSWARQANPDIAYWNQRWDTNFTWENLGPLDTKHRLRQEAWADHARWNAAIVRSVLPPMVTVIREEKPGAMIGFHDFHMPAKIIGLTALDGAFDPASKRFDFYSIFYYYDPGLTNGVEGNLSALREQVERARELYPGVPLFVGELGMAVQKTLAEKRREEEARQADFLTRAVKYLEQESIGYSLWCWRAVVPKSEQTHSLIREDGTMTTALRKLIEHWHPR